MLSKPIATAFAIGAVAAITVPAFAKDNGDRSIQSCRKVTDKESRLACYDALADGEAATIAGNQKRQFGLAEQQKAPEDRKEVDEITAKIASVSGSRVALDNNMVWKIEDGARVAEWLRPGQSATISRGFFSGYRMMVDGVAGKATVTRLQ